MSRPCRVCGGDGEMVAVYDTRNGLPHPGLCDCCCLTPEQQLHARGYFQSCTDNDKANSKERAWTSRRPSTGPTP